MNHEQNEFMAKVLFGLFAVLSILMSKVHADTLAFTPAQERAIVIILEKELQLEHPDLKVTFFRCDETQKTCETVLKEKKRATNIFCKLHNVEISDFKKSSFSILDPFYFNKIKSCL